jgi:hypothetical protein|tara:strand:+ start:2379 stop:2651 length:273 start_codon:yes stop_codon:yes gene_type:complete
MYQPVVQITFLEKKPRLHNDAHTPPTRIAMSSNATLGVETRARKGKRERRDASAANGGEAFPRLPNHLVVEHFSDLSISTTPQISHGSQR